MSLSDQEAWDEVVEVVDSLGCLLSEPEPVQGLFRPAVDMYIQVSSISHEIYIMAPFSFHAYKPHHTTQYNENIHKQTMHPLLSLREPVLSVLNQLFLLFFFACVAFECLGFDFILGVH